MSTKRAPILAAAGLASGVILTACLTAGPGACSSAEATAFREIDHYPGQALMPQDHPLGGCGATFMSGDGPDRVIDHYRSALAETDWRVEGAESSPMTAEDGSVIGHAINLWASRDSMSFSVGAEVLEGSEPTYNVLVADSN